jgi:hypothetical protein
LQLLAEVSTGSAGAVVQLFAFAADLLVNLFDTRIDGAAQRVCGVGGCLFSLIERPCGRLSSANRFDADGRTALVELPVLVGGCRCVVLIAFAAPTVVVLEPHGMAPRRTGLGHRLPARVRADRRHHKRHCCNVHRDVLSTLETQMPV